MGGYVLDIKPPYLSEFLKLADLRINYFGEKIRSETFKQLHNLKSLDINLPFLNSFPENLFQDLISLQNLKLTTSKQFNLLNENTFQGLGKLSNLELIYGFYLLSNNIFKLTPNLRRLCLVSFNDEIQNKLSEKTMVESDLFDEKQIQKIIDGLKEKTDETKGLISIPKGLFNGLSMLENLQLSGNLLTKFNMNELEGSQKLRLLDLAKNPFKELHLDLSKFPNLQIISLHGCVMLEKVTFSEIDLSRISTRFVILDCFKLKDFPDELKLAEISPFEQEREEAISYFKEEAKKDGGGSSLRPRSSFSIDDYDHRK